MNQSRSLKDVIWPLALHLAIRNAVKFRIDQSGGFFGGIRIAPLHSVQQQSEFRWLARHGLLLAFEHFATVYSHAWAKGIPAGSPDRLRSCEHMSISAHILRSPI